MASLRNSVSVLIAVGTLLTTCHGDGEYIVLRAPPSVRFRQQPVELLPVSDIPLIALATFGYSPQPEMHWTGLYQVSPFHTVNAAILFSVVTYPGSPFDGSFSSYLVPSDAGRFPTIQDNDEIDINEIVDVLANRQSSAFLDVRLLNNGNVAAFTDATELFGNMSDLNVTSSFHGDIKKIADEGGRELTVELGLIQHVLNSLKNGQHKIRRATQDLYHFRLEGLAKLAERHGSNSAEFARGLQLTEQRLRQAVDEFFSIYSGNAIVQLVTTMKSYTESSAELRMPAGVSDRRQRQLLQTTTDTNLTLSLNLAPTFSWLYPEMFNIGLWFTVVFALIVFGVAWCMWFIDPGYDSVIYRLTTPPRMKID